jgi:hypothetical protein
LNQRQDAALAGEPHMQRAHFVSLMALAVAIPAATAAGSFLSPDASAAKPCFAAGKAAYAVSHGAAADYTVRIDNAAASPSLRMQIVDDPAAADFVLVDEDDAVQACKTAASVKTIRIDAAAAEPDVTVAMTRGNADYKVFVKSANFTDEDAAALFAVIWRSARKSGTGLAFATGTSR